MRRANWQHETPTVFVNGREFLVDFGAKEFRCVGDAFRRTHFQSAQGRRFWSELMILTCRGCGLTAVKSRHIEVPSVPFHIEKKSQPRPSFPFLRKRAVALKLPICKWEIL